MIDHDRQQQLRAAIESLFFGYRAFTSHPDRILERRGLGRVHHRILYFVGRHPDIAINALLQVLGVSKQALNAPLRQLTQMQLITLRPGAQDGRVRQLRLTASGANLEAQLTGTQMTQLAQVFDRAGGAAEQGWRTIMEQLGAAAR